MAYGDFKDLPKIIDTDNALRDKAFNIGSNPKHDENQRQLASIVHNFLIKKNAGSAVENEFMQNTKLAKELHKPVTRKFAKQKVHPL